MYLITRPQQDAAPLAAKLADRGIDTMIAPMMAIETDTGQRAALNRALEDNPALLFTSVNGVRAFCALSDRRDLHVFAVGSATGQACRQAGFKAVEIAGGDVYKLAALVEQSWHDRKTPLLHVAGKTLAGDLAGMLEKAGHTVTRLTLYEAVASADLAGDVQDAFRAGRIEGVLFFSPRTARIFNQLLEQHKLVETIEKTEAHCLSPAVADVLRDTGFSALHVAAFPTTDDLLQTVWDAHD